MEFRVSFHKFYSLRPTLAGRHHARKSFILWRYRHPGRGTQQMKLVKFVKWFFHENSIHKYWNDTNERMEKKNVK